MGISSSWVVGEFGCLGLIQKSCRRILVLGISIPASNDECKCQCTESPNNGIGEPNKMSLLLIDLYITVSIIMYYNASRLPWRVRPILESQRHWTMNIKETATACHKKLYRFWATLFWCVRDLKAWLFLELSTAKIASNQQPCAGPIICTLWWTHYT